MDLNFIVFPKPSFRAPNDVFYSRLLFVPKQQREIKNLILKKASMLNKSSDRESVNSDGEAKIQIPLSIVRQSFDYSKFKGATAPIFNKKTQSSDCDLKEEDHEINVKQEIRTFEKRVRLPIQRGTTSIMKLISSVNNEFASSPAKVPDIRRLAIQSSRFTRNPRQNSTGHATLSKLMNDLDGFKRNKPNEVKLISQLERKFNKRISKGGKVENSLKQVIKEERSFDSSCEPPVERPTLVQEKCNFGPQFTSPKKTGPLRIFPQRSLHQLKSKDADLDENSNIGIIQRFGNRPLIKLAKEKSKSSNSSLLLQNDPLEEVGKLQSPQHIMPKYTGTPTRLNKLGDLFIKRKDNFNPKQFYMTETLGCKTDVQLSIRLNSESNATRNKNYIENTTNETESIPCLLMKPEFPTDIVLLYFHANGEDLQQCQYFCELLKSSLNVS